MSLLKKRLSKGATFMSTLQSQRDMQSVGAGPTLKYDVVFGPYQSRRFGRSLAVNPLAKGARFCNFDCIYCECSTGGSWPLEWQLRPQFPTADDVYQALVAAADAFETEELDSITIAGNGEPTLSPHLDAIVDVVNAARERNWPQARTIILSNGTASHKPSVLAALAKLDERVIKLDAGSNWILEQLNRPAGKMCVPELVHRIAMVPDVTIQSMFVHGPIDNTGPSAVEAWTAALSQVRPANVQIYSLDRQPAKSWVRQVPLAELQSIASYAQSATGIPVHVF
jgi:wyosine [tRNA(Phe)-imidazoG37] synthetase (radical SAM superfamily)